MSHPRLDQANSTILTAVFSGVLVLLPLLFLPIFQQAFETPKLLLIAFTMVVVSFFWAAHSIVKRSLQLTVHPFTLPSVVYIVGFILSVWIAPTYFNQALSSIEGALFLFSIILLLTPTVWKKVNEQLFLEIGVSLSIVLLLISVLQLFGIGPSSILNALFPFSFATGFQFSPAGSPLIALSFILPFYIALLAELVVHQKIQEKLFQLVAAIILTVGLGVFAWRLFPGMPDSPVLLPLYANWQIAGDTLKNPVTALLGFGPGNFGDAYTLFKPAQMNATPHWNITFQAGSNAPLTLFVSTGFIGLLAWLALCFQIARNLRHINKSQTPLVAGILTTVLIQLFLPLNMVLVGVFFIFLIIWVVLLQDENRPSVVNILFQFAARLFHKEEEQKSFAILPYISATLIAIFAVFISYTLLRNTLAEFFHFRSLLAIQANDGVAAYNRVRQAVRFNPYNDMYHRAYAQINFALANSISEKEELSENDRTQLAQLMQQAIRETRVAAQINPRNSQNWKIMAEVYRSLLGSVEGADRFTLAAYAQAISTAPTDPVLRVDLGGVFLRANNYQQASELFMQAARLKPDYANALYNWGKALEGLENYAGALELYKHTLTLIPEESADRAALEKDIEEMEKKVAQTTTSTPSTNSKSTEITSEEDEEIVENEDIENSIPEEPEEVEELPPQPKPQSELLETEPDVENVATNSAESN